MIKNLVPEARVVSCHIFNGGTTLHPPDLYNEDENGPIEKQEGSKSEGEDMRSAAGERTRMSALDGVNKRERSDGSDVDMSEADSMRPDAVMYPFSAAWIEEEALILLGTIQKNALAEKTADRSKVLLAGYGLGGIVVKQVLATFPNAVLELTS